MVTLGLAASRIRLVVKLRRVYPSGQTDGDGPQSTAEVEHLKARLKIWQYTV